ncbi:MAG: HYR domain-containing protein, partial [Gaiellaceae bacterium]
MGYTVTDSNSAANISCNDGTTGTGSASTTATYTVATHTITCTDDVGSPTLQFVITVQDTTAPSFSNVPGDFTVEATSSSGATVSYTAPTATDIVDGDRPVSCSPGPGTFTIGPHPVTCTASDTSGHTANASFTVTVSDTTDPVVTVPADISTTTDVPGGKTVNFSVSANDNLDGSITPSCDHTSGSNFPIGQTTVTCSATDAHSNTGTATFKVTITLVDTTKPIVTVPADISTTTDV